MRSGTGERTFEEDRSRRVPLRWLAEGRFVTAHPASGVALLLGAKGFGRYIFSRMLYGSRATLLIAVIATLGATLLGAPSAVSPGRLVGRWTPRCHA